MEITVNILNKSNNKLPDYQTVGASGLDVSAYLEEPVILHPMQRALIPTGLYLEIPDGYEIQLRPRSGLALKHGITLLNSPATIDADYRGEIKILLINLSTEPFQIENGMRIAQMVLAKVERLAWNAVSSISHTTRNQNGFGHTGIS